MNNASFYSKKRLLIPNHQNIKTETDKRSALCDFYCRSKRIYFQKNIILIFEHIIGTKQCQRVENI